MYCAYGCQTSAQRVSGYELTPPNLHFWCGTNLSVGRSSPSRLPTNELDVPKKLEAMLGIRERPEDDLRMIRNRVVRGTCQWIRNRSEFVEWVEAPIKHHDPQSLWLIGLPATGKTALTGTVVDHLYSLGHEPQYHFFSADHQTKRTATYCLQSIAYQLARSNESFEEKLLALYDSSGITFKPEKQNFDSIWETIFEGIIFKMTFPTTLYWVLDAVDEADSHQMLLGRLLKVCPSTPIKLFFSSRPIRIPSMAAAYGSSITTLFLSEKDTSDDIQTYVQNAVRESLPEDEEIQCHIVGQVLMKASGSFLWTKLAIEMLRNHWHTQEDIDEILNGIPEGMESLYCRMLDEIRSQPLRFQLMAQRIIAWAACAWRPLSIDELRIALEPEFKGFVSLEDTIVQICGHFVIVDHSKISLIHITARQFLLESKHGGSSFVNKAQVHEHIATVCLNYLSNDVWRHTFMAYSSPNRNDQTRRTNNHLLVIERSHPFLLYATYYWAYHVSQSPVDSEPLRKVLRSFLTRYCVSWIEGVSLSSSLHHLTRSAKYLKVFARRMRNVRHKNLESLLSLRAVEEDLAHDIQSWAIDLIRIVGKFGPNLVQRPSSIYRLVPPFCPHNSNIAKLHHHGGGGGRIMSVSGLPCEGWDDCLATVSAGEDVIASKVLATDAYFLVLISGCGTVIVWHSETCEEARRMHHEEYVLHMVLNRAGTLLATAGTSTYRVWDISSGQELYCLQRGTSSITLAIAFGNHDSELIVGLDDCSVTAFDLENKKEAWRFLAKDPHEDCNGCPRLMKFSPDLTKVAMAWRGRPLIVWDMTIRMYQQPVRCRVTGNTDAMCAPESIEWRKDSTSILILCQNAELVEWHLYDEERVDFSHITAREMAISSDAHLLLTSDNLGTLSIWTFPRLNLIYQLTSTDGFIRSLAFSPDGQRFYDTRQSTCKIWEPKVLVRPDDSDLEDHSSVGGISTAAEAITAHDECGGVSITALVPDAEGKYYCCGREDGTITIHEALQGNGVRKVYSHASGSSAIALNWSHSGRYMVSSDDSGRVISKRLEVKGPSKWSVFPVLDIRLDELVEQFLFNTTERLLLISTPSTDIVYDLKLKKEVRRQRWHCRQSRRWVDHPENSSLLVWVDAMEVRTYTWTELSCTGTFHTSLPVPNCPDPTNLSSDTNLGKLVGPHLLEFPVHWLAVAESTRYIIYGILPPTRRNSSNSAAGLRFHFLSTSIFSVEQPHQPVTDHMTDLGGQVKLLLGTYRDFVVFLDHDYWVCTWKINVGLNAVQRHFFLPRDWLSPSTLQMAVLDAQGAVLCPKHGCVAIIRNGIKF
jgi:WD40 repeat protein